jgi:hypothetical protein
MPRIVRAALLAALAAAPSAGAQGVPSEPPLPEQAPAPLPVPAAPPTPVAPGEIVIPQYPEGTEPPEVPPMLSPMAKATYSQGKLILTGTDVTEGLQAKPVDRVSFYRMVGRPDLAARQEDARSRQLWFIIGGLAVATASIAGGILLSNSNEAPITINPADAQLCIYYSSPRCTIDDVTWQNTTGLIIAVVGGLAGGVLITLGIAANKPVTTYDEDKKLADGYNEALLQHLAGKSKRPSAVPAVGVAAGPGSGMLQARWSF